MLVPTTSPKPAWWSVQNCLPLVPPYDWSCIMYVSSCFWGDKPCMLLTLVLVILAARNVNFCSTVDLTEEVLAVVESDLSVAGWVSFAACWITYSLVAWRRPANSGDSSRDAPTVGSIRQATTGAGLKLMSGCSIHPNRRQNDVSRVVVTVLATDAASGIPGSAMMERW